jgi:release factor glutamine methyltransferase
VTVDLQALLRETARGFEAAGVPSPWVDATALVAYVLGIEPSQVAARDKCSVEEAGRLAELAAARRRRVPLQHLTGHAYFRRLAIEVGPGVFIPRPETELLVDEVLVEIERLRGSGVEHPVVVDLCTGSGAIAASVAFEAPQAQVHAVELSPEAHAWARRNLDGRGVDLRLGDAAHAFEELDGLVDVVVANPPYIPADGIIRDQEVLQHDPPLALWGGGADGLDVPRAVARRATGLLRAGGLLVMEHADVQGAAVVAVLMDTNWLEVSDHRDLAGRDRYVTARHGKMTA